MLRWENEEEEPEDSLRDPQAEEDHQEEDRQEGDHLQLQEEQWHNRSQQRQMSKPWEETPLSSKEKEAKPTPSCVMNPIYFF